MEKMKSTATLIEDKIAKIMKDNPDLPYEFVRGILIALEELKDGLGEPYKFGDL